MTEEELAAIRERADAATPGPWESVRQSEFSEPPRWFVAYAPVMHANHQGRGDTSWMQRPEAEFIAHARQDVPRLLDEIALLRKVVNDLQQESEAFAAGRESAAREIVSMSSPFEVMRRANLIAERRA